MVTADTVQKLIDIIDGVGIPIFAVIGMQLAEERGIPVAGIIFVGVVNGTAGGLLRDVLVRDVPAILRPGQFVTLLLLLACVLFVSLKQFPDVSIPEAAWASIGTFFVLRVLTIRFNWTTRSVLPESLSGRPRRIARPGRAGGSFSAGHRDINKTITVPQVVSRTCPTGTAPVYPNTAIGLPDCSCTAARPGVNVCAPANAPSSRIGLTFST